ncbi:MAG: hypothetical protein HQ510_10070 [Candidatus Marinimicrobia bacterium]|nr:hypothetical protein [Candidatus Neomarinimicrobiota bacterium]
MKFFKVLSIVALSLMLFSCDKKAQYQQVKNEGLTNKIEVIDFHSTHRCMTCNAIESNTVYTLNTFFADELKNGKITFQTVNVDEETNYGMAEKFEASGTSLFLNVIIDKKETQYNLTDFAFMKGRDQNAFSEELKQKIEVQLSKMK